MVRPFLYAQPGRMVTCSSTLLLAHRRQNALVCLLWVGRLGRLLGASSSSPFVTSPPPPQD